MTVSTILLIESSLSLLPRRLLLFPLLPRTGVNDRLPHFVQVDAESLFAVPQLLHVFISSYPFCSVTFMKNAHLPRLRQDFLSHPEQNLP